MFNIDEEKYRIIDISYKVVPGANELRPFEAIPGRLSDGCHKFDVQTNTHVGTHVECGAHFLDDGKAVDQYPLDSFYGRGILLHIDLPANNPYVTREYLEDGIGSLICDGDILVCRNPSRAEPTGRRFFTEDALHYLRDKNIKMIVIEPEVHLGDSVEAWRKAHEIFLPTALIAEIADNLDEITRPEFFVMALPILVKGLDSSWCRAIVIEVR